MAKQVPQPLGRSILERGKGSYVRASAFAVHPRSHARRHKSKRGFHAGGTQASTTSSGNQRRQAKGGICRAGSLLPHPCTSQSGYHTSKRKPTEGCPNSQPTVNRRKISRDERKDGRRGFSRATHQLWVALCWRKTSRAGTGRQPTIDHSSCLHPLAMGWVNLC